MRDLYKVLGVSSGADDVRVRSAFRKLAKTVHPDLNSGDERAEQHFKELNQAYETLSDPKARAAYELGLADERTRARRNMRHVAITMFAISMLSTGAIFGTLIWLLTVSKQVSASLTDRDASPPKEIASSPQEPQEKRLSAQAGDLGSNSRVEVQPKQPDQLSAAVAGNAVAPPPAAMPRQAIAAPPRSSQRPPDPQPSPTSCHARLAEVEPGMLSMTLVDQHRRGSSIIVKVDDLDYRATFTADGRLTLVAPSLSDTPVLQWALADGTPCRQIATVPQSPGLRIALAWAGYAGLEMQVIEPNSWLGRPVEPISSDRSPDRRNLDGVHGAGQIRTFGQPGDSTRVQLFVMDSARSGDRGFLNAVITLDRAGIGSCAEVGQASEVRFHVYIHHGGGRSGVRRPEVRSMAFRLPRCGEPEGDRRRSETILVRF